MNELEHSARQTLRNSELNLDDATSSELIQRRKSALTTRPKRKIPSFLAPALGMAAASLVALVLIYPYGSENMTTQGGFFSENTLTENTELYEDLDFYYWLASNDRSLEG